MKLLWAPWREKLFNKKENKKCLFCLKLKQKKLEKNFILFKNKNCFALLNIFPYNNGHIMIAPYKHISDINLLSQKEIQEIFKLLKCSINALKKAFKPNGFNIGINLGKAAGAGVEKHLHLHIVPRWTGDTNFMPIISNTKIVSQSLISTYKKLKPLIKNEMQNMF